MKNKKKYIPVSIVIPTLGNKNLLLLCLKKIYASSHLPHEVLIVLPKDNYNRIQLIKNKFQGLKIKLILSKKKNQIDQRILGFKKAKSNYIMQLDDDVKLERYCLNKLYEFIVGKKNLAVAPRYADKLQLSKIYLKPKNIILKFYHWILNSSKGFDAGKISLSGINYSQENLVNGYKVHDWLSGGAVIHHKKNLILNNYYPYKFSRSVCEDVLHSLLLTQKKIKLIKYFGAKVYAKESSRINSEPMLFDVIKSLYNEFLIRKYIVKKFNFSKSSLIIYYLIYFIRIILNRIKK